MDPNLSIEQQLAQMQDDWDASQNQYDQMFGGVTVPPNKYLAQLRNATVVRSKSSGNLQIKREHILLEGDYAGMIVYDYMQMQTANGPVFIRRWIEMMGYQNPENMKDVPATIKAIVDESPTVEIEVIQDGEFTNVSVTALVGADEAGTIAPPATASVSPATQAAEEEIDIAGIALSTIVSLCEVEGVSLEGIDTTNPDAVYAELAQYQFEFANLEAGSYDVLCQIELGDIVLNAPAEEADDEDPMREKLAQFCVGQGIALEADDDTEMLLERVKCNTYDISQLTDTEQAILTEAGLEEYMVVPTPKAPAEKAPAAKAPAAKAPAAKAPAAKAPAAKSVRRIPARKA